MTTLIIVALIANICGIQYGHAKYITEDNKAPWGKFIGAMYLILLVLLVSTSLFYF